MNIKIREVSLLALLTIATIGELKSQDSNGTAFSLKDCIEYASGNHPNIKVSRLDEEIAAEQIRQYRADGLPQINAAGSFEDRIKIPLLIIPDFDIPGASGGIPTGYQYNTTAQAEATQMIYDQSFWVALKTAESNTKYARQSTRQVTEQTAYNVADAYYQVIVAQKQLDLLRENSASTQTTLNNTQLQFEQGIAKKVDVSRLQVSLNNLNSQIKQAELAVEQAYNNLKFRMGMNLTERIALSDTTLNLTDPGSVDLEFDKQQAYSQRVDYNLLQTSLNLQTLERKNNAAGYYPSLSAFGNYAYSAQGSEFALYPTGNNEWVDFTSSSIGIRLSIPIFDGFRKSALVQQSQIRIDQIREQMTLTELQIDLELSNAQAQYKSTLERIESEQRNVELAQQVFTITQLEYNEGVGTSNDVVESETSLRQAQNNYITTLLDLYTARLDMERAKGTLLNYLNIN